MLCTSCLMVLKMNVLQAEMMEEEKSRGILVVMFLFAVSFPDCGGLASSDCSPSTTETNGEVRLMSGVVDKQRAEQSQRQHLEALFNR